MLHIHCSFSFREKRPKLTYTKISRFTVHCSLSFRGPHVRLALLTELPSLNKEFIVIIIIKEDNHSTV